jgi:uracil phosphoribosyltransferase
VHIFESMSPGIEVNLQDSSDVLAIPILRASLGMRRDEGLNEVGFIVPGIGDAEDRLFEKS